MDFNERVLETLKKTISNKGLKVSIDFENCIELSNEKIAIRIVHNNLENSNIIWINPNKEKDENIELDDNILKEFFKSNLKISNVTTDVFLVSLKEILENPEYDILLGDSKALTELMEFNKKRSEDYSRKLFNSQKLIEANAAWINKDYNLFIKLMEAIDISQLPDSYKHKLKIAYKKLKQ